jgi:hypothetical protein
MRKARWMKSEADRDADIKKGEPRKRVECSSGRGPSGRKRIFIYLQQGTGEEEIFKETRGLAETTVEEGRATKNVEIAGAAFVRDRDQAHFTHK